MYVNNKSKYIEDYNLEKKIYILKIWAEFMNI